MQADAAAALRHLSHVNTPHTARSILAFSLTGSSNVLSASGQTPHDAQGECDDEIPIHSRACDRTLNAPRGTSPSDGPARAAPGGPDVKGFDQRLAEAQAQMQRMQVQMNKLRQTQDPQERQKLLQEHYATMQA